MDFLMHYWTFPGDEFWDGERGLVCTETEAERQSGRETEAERQISGIVVGTELLSWPRTALNSGSATGIA